MKKSLFYLSGITLSLTISINLFAQKIKKKDLVRKINNYKISVLLDTTYQIPQDSWKSIVNYYFTSNDFILAKDRNSLVTYSKKIPLKYTIVGQSDPVNPSYPVNPTFYPDYYKIHRCNITLMTKVFVTLAYESTPTGLKMIIKPVKIDTRNTLASRARNTPPYHFDELSLRKYLYIRCYGNNIPLPKELQDKITAYNSSQKKDKRKLHRGVDY